MRIGAAQRRRWFAFAISICVLTFSGVAFTQTSSPAPRPSTPTADARVAFDALKLLAGTWNGRVTTQPSNPQIEGPIQVAIRVGSRGNVLLHEIVSGGQPEPTLIFVENDRLALVHYCDAGNRPRLLARPSDEKTTAFDFVDISGRRAPAFVEHVEFAVTDPTHHLERWIFVLAGDQRLRAEFDLTRSSSNANPGGPTD